MTPRSCFGGTAGVVVGSSPASNGIGGGSTGGNAKSTTSSSTASSGGIHSGGVILSHDLGPKVYRLYSNGGLGGSIDYQLPIAETTELSWTTDPLTPGASYRFAVRVRDIATGLEEENLDATTSLILAADGQDATKLPSPPFGLRAIDQGSGKVRFEWTTSPSNHPPTHFNLYIGRDGMLEFTSPTTIPIATMRGEVMATEVHGLMDGMPLAAVIRAVNSHGEEGNVRSIRFTVDHTPPERVDGLAASISTNLD